MPAAAPVVSGWPSSQENVQVWVSLVPTSVKFTVTVEEVPSGCGAIGPVTVVATGATLLTVTLVLAFADPCGLPLSVTVTVMVYTSDAVAVGLSSRYWWLAEEEKTPAARVNVVIPSVPPQLIVTVWVSPMSGSVNVPETVVD